MIITKTPFRVSFCGGGSDFPDFYMKYGGCVLSTSINKYMYISIHPQFDEKITMLKYSQTEIVEDIRNIKHRILNNVLNKFGLSGVEITSTADIPAGTGLGSSSAFTVGLLHIINAYRGKQSSKSKLAEMACMIEINELGSPIGKQDQYASSFGGLNLILFNTNDSVSVEPILINKDTYSLLQKSLVLFYTGDVRNANKILLEQRQNFNDRKKINNILRMCELAKVMKKHLESGDSSSVGDILNESWHLKKELASGISSDHLDDIYNLAIQNGAKGGKLLGAGGAGFFLFYCDIEKQYGLRKAIGLKEMKFTFENDGSSLIYIGDKYWD